jgi:hypothetical protein
VEYPEQNQSFRPWSDDDDSENEAVWFRKRSCGFNTKLVWNRVRLISTVMPFSFRQKQFRVIQDPLSIIHCFCCPKKMRWPLSDFLPWNLVSKSRSWFRILTSWSKYSKWREGPAILGFDEADTGAKVGDGSTKPQTYLQQRSYYQFDAENW